MASWTAATPSSCASAERSASINETNLRQSTHAARESTRLVNLRAEHAPKRGCTKAEDRDAQPGVTERPLLHFWLRTSSRSCDCACVGDGSSANCGPGAREEQRTPQVRNSAKDENEGCTLSGMRSRRSWQSGVLWVPGCFALRHPAPAEPGAREASGVSQRYPSCGDCSHLRPGSAEASASRSRLEVHHLPVSVSGCRDARAECLRVWREQELGTPRWWHPAAAGGLCQAAADGSLSPFRLSTSSSRSQPRNESHTRPHRCDWPTACRGPAGRTPQRHP